MLVSRERYVLREAAALWNRDGYSIQPSIASSAYEYVSAAPFPALTGFTCISVKA